MSGSSSKWREEQILIVCPGSRTTMAQLGCGELTPPSYRIPTRMFRDEETGDWRPYRTWKRKKTGSAAAAMAATTTTSDGADNGSADDAAKDADSEEWEYVEDPDSDEGAVYPMDAGYIVNMEAFLAFLEHVHGLLTTTYHNTPIVLMTSPQWSRPDCEAIALYVFEKTRTPALCMINSALATQYGLKWPHMTVVDIGFAKVDVTCIYDSRVVNHMHVGYPRALGGGSLTSGIGLRSSAKNGITATDDHGDDDEEEVDGGGDGDDRVLSGGELFTRRLQTLLRDRHFTYEMAEQLKRSPLCEVLPYAPEHPRLMELPEDGAAPPVATAGTATANNGAASTGGGPAAVLSAAAGTAGDPARDEPPRGATDPAAQRTAAAVTAGGGSGEVDDGTTLDEAADGVLDVATIVTSGHTKEFLAKKEKERTERGRFGRRAKDKEAEAAAARPVRLPNAKRARAVFHFEELVEEEEQDNNSGALKNNNGNTAGATSQPGSQQYQAGSSGAAGGGSSSTNGTASENRKSQDENADGSDEGSDEDGSEMDEDEDEEGEGDGADGEGDAEEGRNAKGDANGSATKSSTGFADKPKSEAADSAAVKDETSSAAKPEAAAAPASTSEPEANKTAEPTEAAPDAAKAGSSDDKAEERDAPAKSAEDVSVAPAAKPETEDATMTDAPAAADTTGETAQKAPTEKSTEEEQEQPQQSQTENAAPAEDGALTATNAAAAAAAAAAATAEQQGRRVKRVRRDFEIGLERFTFADRRAIDRIVATIYRTVQNIEDMYMRPACWENLVFVGNGCRLRGLRENILQTLHARHLVSPSTATIFTSELPSNLGTPSGTGAQTPTGNFSTPPHQLPTSSSVNPLLQAATTASLLQAPHGGGGGGPGSTSGDASGGGGGGHMHHFHSQTPTSIKLAALPTYLGEWTKNGFEESMFLGAQVAARLAFCVHNLDAQGQEQQRQMSLTRIEYNELGPKGIRTHSMLG
ncbi:chromatin remodeling complex subunit [Niveomyces insectorum RCEF 264]|uniref:Chromatin remodeling complex subunit n=1 Tax=Niveomyces insectorum RCEF 264 TaxID=1081102 RepID=A0A167PI31_9HYPO|nr:chromatin remodeling complex subunit [Niveomyces insectorum RCEF 264]